MVDQPNISTRPHPNYSLSYTGGAGAIRYYLFAYPRGAKPIIIFLIPSGANVLAALRLRSAFLECYDARRSAV